MGTRHVTIAGGGIAGLTAALAFAQRGYSVTIHEKAERLDGIGAGIQLSPNATRLLDRLGVLSRLVPAATVAEAVVLRDAVSLREIARVPLGDAAIKRWGAAYLAVSRAGLQAALLAAVGEIPAITLRTGEAVERVNVEARTVLVVTGGERTEIEGGLLVGADGAHSRVGVALGAASVGTARETAWRRIALAKEPALQFLLPGEPVVTALLHPRFHLVAYPIRGGENLNLAAFTHGGGDDALTRALGGTPLAALADACAWTRWPIHVAGSSTRWTNPAGIALIGDAAHAMSPFAAQGAAMAVEDAWTLAEAVASSPGDPSALAGWERQRRPRVARVVARGALNRFAWHAAGPVRIGRDLVLRLRGPDRLAADLDWLYGWTPGS